MNPGTFYLYEYENYKRRRNVGFIKVSRYYQSCILQIHVRNIPVRNGSTLKLSAFCREQEKLIISQIADLTSCGRNISIRLSVSETHFPERRPLQQIDGFLLQDPDKDAPPLFWMASSFFFDIRPDMMCTDETKAETTAEPETVPEPDTSPEPETVPAPDTSPEPEPVSEADATPESETVSESDSSPEPETVPESDSSHELETAPIPHIAVPDVVPGSECPSESERPSGAERALQSAESKALPLVKKISREDLTLLPRKFWPLANNSFLLHGYHNYDHLALIEENGRRWLGVPGIYDTREARAADLFGFPRFTRAYVSVLELTDEERNDTADFGHWCRCVGTI